MRSLMQQLRLSCILAASLLFTAGCNDGSPPPDSGTPDASVGVDGGFDAGVDGGSDAGVDGGSDGGAAVPTVIATFSQPPGALALLDATLFVTLSSTAGDNGLLVSVPAQATSATLDAGVTVLASGLRNPHAVAALDGAVYWAAGETVFPNHLGIWGMALDGGSTQEVLSAVTVRTRFAIAAGTVYLTDENYSVILSAPLQLASVSPATVYSAGAPGLFGVDTDGAHVFFFEAGGTGNADLLSVSVDGGAASTVVSNASGASLSDEYTVSDSTAVYWTDLTNTGSIDSTAKTTLAADAGTLVATLADGAPQLLVDGANLYALTATQLVRLPKSGGAPTVLASTSGNDRFIVSSSSNALAMAVDGTYIYWLAASRGQLLRLPK